MNDNEDKPLILRMYRLPSGLWGGRLIVGGQRHWRTLGHFPSTKEAENAAAEIGLYSDRIEIERN